MKRPIKLLLSAILAFFVSFAQAGLITQTKEVTFNPITGLSVTSADGNATFSQSQNITFNKYANEGGPLLAMLFRIRTDGEVSNLDTFFQDASGDPLFMNTSATVKLGVDGIFDDGVEKNISNSGEFTPDSGDTVTEVATRSLSHDTNNVNLSSSLWTPYLGATGETFNLMAELSLDLILDIDSLTPLMASSELGGQEDITLMTDWFYVTRDPVIISPPDPPAMSVPEPGGLPLMGLGLFGLAAYQFKKTRSKNILAKK